MSWRETYIFREIGEPLPKGWLPGHWQVEAHRETGIEAYCCPVGIAWVNTVGKDTIGVVIEFVNVLPQFQRQGVATRLVKECLKRWPGASWTQGISASGKALVARLERMRPRRMKAEALA